MKRTGRMLCSLLLALSLALGMMPGAFAQDEPEETVPGYSGNGIMARGTPDGTPPELISVSVDKTKVEAGGTITVKAEGKDDIAGVWRIYLQFYCKDTGETYSALCWKSNNFEDTIEISQYGANGTFELWYAEVTDNALNERFYYNKNYEYPAENTNYFPQEISFTVYNQMPSPDTTPPELISYSIDKMSVEAPATITVKAQGKDDISEVSGIYVRFHCRETEKGYTAYCNDWNEDGIFEDTIEISQYELNGVFELTEIGIEDKAGNWQYYYSRNNDYLPENANLLPQELSFTVGETNPDSIAPELISVSIDKTSVEAPATITVKVEGKDEISGASSIYVHFRCEETKKSYAKWYFDRDEYGIEDGIFEGTIEISQYELDGVFELTEISIEDNAGNRQTYYSKNASYLPENAKLLPQELSFTVQNDPNHLVSGTQNPNLAEDIKNLPDGTGASVSYESNPHISADVFEAIAGQDKTLTLEGDGIQWEFNGKDIENPKSLDLKVDINPLSRTGSPNADELQEQLRGQEAYVLSFPDNGRLPGKAKIRIKADYAFRRYLGTKNLYVYYYDNTAQEYIPVAANVDMTDDGWLEFTTDHNSDFIITKGEVRAIKPETDRTPPEIVSYSLDKTAVSAGGTLRLTAQGKDDISGVESISFQFVNRQSEKSRHCSCYKEKDGVFEGEMQIPAYNADGVYELDEIAIHDKAGNTQHYYSQNYRYLSDLKEEGIAYKLLPQEISFTVTGSSADTQPPVLTDYSLDKTALKASETLTITAQGTDDLSGVDSVTFEFINRVTGKSRYISCWQNSDGSFEGDTRIPLYNADGIYELDCATIYDNARNEQRYYSKNSEELPYLNERGIAYKLLPKEISFSVTGSISDTQPPAIGSYSLDKTTVKAPGIIRLKADGTDDISGVESISFRFVNRRNGRTRSCSCWEAEEGGFEGSLRIPQYNAGGTYALDEITVYDEAGNSQPYYSKDSKELPYLNEMGIAYKLLPQEISFTVLGSPDDDNYPEPDDTDDDPSTEPDTSGSSSSVNSSTIAPAAPQPLPASAAAKIRSAIRSAKQQAEKTGKSPAALTVRFSDVSEIPAAVLAKIQSAIREENYPADVLLRFTRRENGKLAYTLTLNPLELKNSSAVKLGLRQGDKSVSALFGRYYENRLQIVRLSQEGTFDAPVQLTVPLDTRLNAQSLCFYRYDKAKNQYEKLLNPQYSVDAKGYLTFTTLVGDTLLITDAPLTRKG